MSSPTSSRVSAAREEKTLSFGRADGLVEDSAAKVIIPLSLLKELQLALSKEQAESARKEERISIFHALLRGDTPGRHNADDHIDEIHSLYRLLDLTRLSVDFYYKRSKELEQILIPLLNPNTRRWHFPYANTETYVAECVEELTYVKLNLSSGNIVDMVLLENNILSRS